VSQSPVGIAVIGAGFMGEVYCEAITRLVKHARLVACAGGTRSAALAAKQGVAHEASSEAAFRRPDVQIAIIATPHSTHLPLTLSAARAGKHVFVEKPMGRTVAECDAMLAACREAGVLLAVNKLTRFRESPAATKRLIDQGAIGQVRMLRATGSSVGLAASPDELQRWYLDPAEGSVYLDWGSHICDMLRWLAGSDPVTAYGRFATYTHDIPKPDQSGMAEYTFSNGVLAQVWMSSEVPAPGLHGGAEGHDVSQYIVVGSEGILECDMFGKLQLGKGDSWTVVAEQPPIDWVNAPFHENRIGGWARQVQDFVDCVRNGGVPLVTGEDGRAAVEMVEAAERSHATSSVVRLPLTG
jgi:predicted dehydrogenase